MLNPRVKKKFCTSIYQGQKFEDRAYDQNDKFSVHLPVEEDKYLQKLEQMSRSNTGQCDQKTKAKGAQVNQFDLADKEFDKKSQKSHSSQQRKKKCLKGSKGKAQTTKLPQIRKAFCRKRFGRTMSNRIRPLGPWYYEKYQVKRGMNKYNNSMLKNKLYFDHRTHTIPKTIIRNSIIDDILREERLIVSNNLLRQSLMHLKKMDLIKHKEVVRIKHAGMKKREYVYNDEHSKATNPGFQRTQSGNYFK